MDSNIIDVVAEWDSTAVTGGYAGLHDLADREFTGAVSEGSVWAFVLNGKVVGVFDGDIDAFEDADATAYHAPDPALPLLYAMQAGGGDTRAKYYSNDTPLSSADATLSSGKFTGYIELSENVLSGDYYVVYYGGRSLPVAFVGSSRKLLTGDEAFERADDEVGIYEVKEASVDIVDIPEPEPPQQGEPTDESVAVADQDDTEPANESTVDAADGTPDAVDDAGGDDSTTTETSDDASVGDEPPVGDDTPVDDEPPADDPAATPRAEDDHPEPVSTAEAAEHDSVDDQAASTPEPVPDTTPDSVEETESDPAAETNAATSVTSNATAAAAAAADDDVFSEEAEWREATSIPALDPKKSAQTDRAAGTATGGTSPSSASVSQRTRKRRRQTSQSPAQQRQQAQSQGDSQSQSKPQQHRSADANDGPQRADVARLKEQLQTTAREKEELEAARERLAAERDDYREKAERAKSRVSELEAEVERLETELADVRVESPTASAAETMAAEAALDGTNLFVRYGTKSGGTLEKAHAGDVERGEVNENLRLEHHTGFETDGVVVDGESYETFLHDSIEYGFVRWVVEDLLYEIRETGNSGSLEELFDAIPKVDRAELHGDVTLKYTENGEEHREQQSFDVVLRDRMGNPLVVANLNGSRDPATEGMMTSLVENTSRLRESNESLGAAFLVTASYFDPGALETAADATGGGLLSRGRRKSFVKLSRKQGFHLCLVETRNGDFHLNVPEL